MAIIRVSSKAGFKELREAVHRLSAELEALRLMTSSTVKIRRTTKGTFLDVVKAEKVEQQKPTDWFQGEYVPGKTYKAGQGVVVRTSTTGGTPGTYMCIKDTGAGTPAPQDPPTNPGQGLHWIQIAAGNTIGVWT